MTLAYAGIECTTTPVFDAFMFTNISPQQMVLNVTVATH